MYTLGRADYGRLGHGEGCTEKTEPTLVAALQSETCVDIAAGGCVSFALTDTGQYCFSFKLASKHCPFLWLFLPGD